MTLNEAKAIIGNLSEPSKMPCYGYSISALKCITGGKLYEIEGSVCNKCYARRGNYLYDNVKNAHDFRLNAFNHPNFVLAMATVINATESSGYFRWFDSGDLQSEKMLAQICEIASLCGRIKFWLPTKEISIVSSYIKKGNKVPKNLNIRLSSYMIDGPAFTTLAQSLGVTTSTVVRNGWTCRAPKQNNKCLDCRLCWSTKVKNVAYRYH